MATARIHFKAVIKTGTEGLRKCWPYVQMLCTGLKILHSLATVNGTARSRTARFATTSVKSRLLCVNSVSDLYEAYVCFSINKRMIKWRARLLSITASQCDKKIKYKIRRLLRGFPYGPQ